MVIRRAIFAEIEGDPVGWRIPELSGG